MNYYVRKDGSSKIEGPFDLESIRGYIALGRFTGDYEGAENEHGPWSTLEEIFAMPVPRHFEQFPASFLEAVREQSCFKGLRLCADALAVVAVGGPLVYLFSARALLSGPAASGLILWVLVSVIAGLLSRFLATAIADIADILIEKSRRK